MGEYQVAQAQTATKPTITPIAGGVLQRECGQHTDGGGECDEWMKKREGTLQRAAIDSASVNAHPLIVHQVLRSSGEPLDAAMRAFAIESARSVLGDRER